MCFYPLAFGLVLLEYIHILLLLEYIYSVLDTATGEYFLLESERRYLFELYYLVGKKIPFNNTFLL